MSRPSCRSRRGPGSFVLIDKKQIVNMGETSEDFWQRFAVNLQSGIIYSKGNQSTQYNISSSVTYARPRWAAGLDFNSALAANSGANTSTRNQLNFDAYHLLPWKNYFYAGQVGFLQSTEQGIDLRTNVSGGVGKYLKHSGRVSVSLLGGLGWQNTNYSPTEQSQGTQEILALLVNSSLRVVTFSKTNLDVSVSALPALSDPGRFFFNTNAQLLRQALEQPHLQPLLLRELGHQAARDLQRQRLRFQLGVGMELRQSLDAAVAAEPTVAAVPSRAREYYHPALTLRDQRSCGFHCRPSCAAGSLALAPVSSPYPRLSASEKTDVLYMKNGDRLTCEIKSLNAGSLDIKLDYVDGTISVEWSEVERLDSKRLFLVTLDDGTVYSGRLSIAETGAGEPEKLRITTASGDYALIDKTHIVEVLKTSDQFWQRFAVDLNSGVIYSKGNQSTQFNFSTKITYPRPSWAASIAFNSSLSKSFRGHGLDPQRPHPECVPPAPMEELLLRRAGWFPAERRTEHRPAHQPGGRDRQVREAFQPGQRRPAWRAWLAEHAIYPDDGSAGGAGCPRAPAQRQPACGDLQQDEHHAQRQYVAGAFPARPLLLQYQRQRVLQAVQQPEIEHVVLWQLGYGAARDLFRQRLRAEFRAGLDLRQ